MTRRFLIAAGGTGGHVQPALAVARELQGLDPDCRIHFVGGRRGIEGRLVPAAGFSLTRLPAAGLRGLGAGGALRFALSFAIAFLLALPLILRLRPDAVLATGGYASAAPAVAAAMLGRPLWLQEQNSIPGSTNRFLARFAERAYVAFEEGMAALRRAERVEQLPNPVRREIFEARGRRPSSADYQGFGLEPGRPTLFVFGGSRGAERLNEAVAEAFAEPDANEPWQALVQTGEDGLRGLAPRLAEHPRVRLRPYIEDMAAAYAVSSLVACRAGALTLAELAAVGKASVLVPFPHATDDHQTRNARAFEDAGAARVLGDEQFDGARLRSILAEFSGNPAALETMGEAAAQIAAGRNGAAELAAALISRADERRAA